MNSKSLIDFFRETAFAQIILITVLITIAWFFRFSFLVSDNQQNIGHASIIFHFAKQDRRFEGDIVSGMTVLDGFTAATQAGSMSMRYQFSKSGNLISVAIAGQKISRIAKHGKSIPVKDLVKTPLGDKDNFEIFFSR